MGYSDDDSMVRVDFFKPTGKWYATEAIQLPEDFVSGLEKAGMPTRLESKRSTKKKA